MTTTAGEPPGCPVIGVLVIADSHARPGATLLELLDAFQWIGTAAAGRHDVGERLVRELRPGDRGLRSIQLQGAATAVLEQTPAPPERPYRLVLREAVGGPPSSLWEPLAASRWMAKALPWLVLDHYLHRNLEAARAVGGWPRRLAAQLWSSLLLGIVPLLLVVPVVGLVLLVLLQRLHLPGAAGLTAIVVPRMEEAFGVSFLEATSTSASDARLHAAEAELAELEAECDRTTVVTVGDGAAAGHYLAGCGQGQRVAMLASIGATLKHAYAARALKEVDRGFSIFADGLYYAMGNNLAVVMAMAAVLLAAVALSTGDLPSAAVAAAVAAALVTGAALFRRAMFRWVIRGHGELEAPIEAAIAANRPDAGVCWVEYRSETDLASVPTLDIAPYAAASPPVRRVHSFGRDRQDYLVNVDEVASDLHRRFQHLASTLALGPAGTRRRLGLARPSAVSAERQWGVRWLGWARVSCAVFGLLVTLAVARSVERMTAAYREEQAELVENALGVSGLLVHLLASRTVYVTATMWLCLTALSYAAVRALWRAWGRSVTGPTPMTTKQADWPRRSLVRIGLLLLPVLLGMLAISPFPSLLGRVAAALATDLTTSWESFWLIVGLWAVPVGLYLLALDPAARLILRVRAARQALERSYDAVDPDVAVALLVENLEPRASLSVDCRRYRVETVVWEVGRGRGRRLVPEGAKTLVTGDAALADVRRGYWDGATFSIPRRRRLFLSGSLPRDAATRPLRLADRRTWNRFCRDAPELMRLASLELRG